MKHQYKIGEVVEVIGRECGHEFEIGQQVIVTILDEDGEVWECMSLDGSESWIMDEDELRPI